MPWARLDDNFYEHKKTRRVLKTEPIAGYIHILAVAYCSRHNTDGEIDTEVIDDWVAKLPLNSAHKKRIRDALVKLELFATTEDPETLVVVDYLQWNRSRAERLALADQGRRGGLAKAKANGKPGPEPTPSRGSSERQSDSQSEGSSNGSSTPSHATPTPTSSRQHASRADREREKASDDDQRLCRLLAEFNKDRNPKFRVKSQAEWLRSMRLLRQQDGNSPADTERLIRWLFTDTGRDAQFWAGVIQSPANLREHFAQIWGKMQAAPLHAVPAVEDSASYLARRGA